MAGFVTQALGVDRRLGFHICMGAGECLVRIVLLINFLFDLRYIVKEVALRTPLAVETVNALDRVLTATAG